MVDSVTLARDSKHYNSALIAAYQSDYTTRVGCVAAKGNKKICTASNVLRNPAKNVNLDGATYHAEMNVLNMLEKPDKVTLYIARLGRGHLTHPSRPCNRCMDKIREFGIREIVYLDQFRLLVKEIL